MKLKIDQIKKGYAMLIEAYPKNYASEVGEELWLKKFRGRDAEVFGKMIDVLTEQEGFPSIAKALATYKLILGRVQTSNIKQNFFQKSCGWCEGGKVYYTKTYFIPPGISPIRGQKGNWDYLGACAICHPDGFRSLAPIDARRHDDFAKIPIERGGPILIDPNLVANGQNYERGIDEYESNRVKIPSDMIPGSSSGRTEGLKKAF